MMNFNKIFRENVTYDDIKIDYKTKLYTVFTEFFELYSYGYHGFFLNETSILIFGKLAIFHSI